MDFERSFVGLVHLFNDKSQISLSTGLWVFTHFTPYFSTLQNGHEEPYHKWKYVSYVLTSEVTVTVENGSCLQKKKIGRVEILHALHESIKNTLEPLATSAIQSFSIKTSNCSKLIMYPDVASYVVDSPEYETLLGVKRRVSPASPCHRCLIQK